MTIDSDLNTLRVYLAEFESYIKSEVVFWNVGHNLPALTLGAMLSLTARRGTRSGSPARLAEFDQLESQARLIFNRWPANIEKKALREIGSRLNVWAAALDDPGDNYAQSVQNRVYLALLMPLVERQAEAERFRSRLAALDVRLHNRFTPGDFIWEADLATAFARDEFWFLYGGPRKRD